MNLRTAVFAASMLLTARLAMADPLALAKVVLDRQDDRVTVTVEGASASWAITNSGSHRTRVPSTACPAAARSANTASS